MQWATAEAGDWAELDVRPGKSAWAQTPARPEPRGGERLDARGGWVVAVSVQGVVFEGFDHYSVGAVGADGVNVWVWNDDPEEWPPGTRYAEHWRFLPPALDDNGALNTRQRVVRYLEPDAPAGLRVPARTAEGPVEVLPWSAFKPPTDARHGIWLASIDPYRAARRPVNWRE